MSKNNREKFLKKKSFLWWGVKDVKKISNEAMLEGVLNYGDWCDVLEVFNILGREKAAKIFFKQIQNKRVNYQPETLNYFKLYFKKNVLSNTKQKTSRDTI